MRNSKMENIVLKNKLLDLFYYANSLFIKKNILNILANVSERNLCAQLGYCISQLLEESEFSNYYSDVEYNRNGGQVKTIIDEELNVIDVTCDLIVHSRGNLQKDNLIAIEMKKHTATEEQKDSDRKRLRCLTKQNCKDVYTFRGNILPVNVCKYEIGIMYIINISRKVIRLEIYCDSELISVEENTFNYFSKYNE